MPTAMIITLKVSTRAPRVIQGSPPRSGTCSASSFFICVTLVVELALLNCEIIDYQNQHKYSVLGWCWLRCLLRGCVSADILASRISKHMFRKGCNFAGLGALFFPDHAQTAPTTWRRTRQPCPLNQPSWLTSPPEIPSLYFLYVFIKDLNYKGSVK